MSMTASEASVASLRRPRPRGQVTLRRVADSEWIKLRTLRSSWYILIAAFVGMVVIGLIVGYATTHSNWATLQTEDSAPSAPLQGYKLAELFIGVLGALFVSAEYGTGMIRSTFAAVPGRLPVVAAKGIVVAVVVLVVATAASFATFFAAQLFLGPDGHGSSPADPGALRAVVGAGLYLVLVGLLGSAFGWIVRSTAGAISALFGLLLVTPLLFQLLPGSVSQTIGEYLPSNAGGTIVSSFRQPHELAPWSGLAVFAVWVVCALIAATVVVRRRDA
jgi:ABC-type transport system involved in multi-copper enzyme maturation permease subunit